MSEETNVLIERDGRRFKWGEARYLRTWNGMKETVSIATLRFVALPLALLIGVWSYFFSDRNDALYTGGREFSTPSINDPQTSSQINAPILNEQDLINRIPREKVSLGTSGRIRVYSLRSTSAIPIASEARSVLQSGATNGIVKARLIEAMRVDGETLLPEGTIVFGQGKSNDERLAIEFRKAIFPGGETIAIRAQAFDLKDKILGLKGAVVGSRTKKMGLAMGFGVLGGAMDSLQTPASSAWGATQQRSVRDAALAGAGKAALDQSQMYLDEIKNAPNVIEVKSGTEFILMIDEPKEEK